MDVWELFSIFPKIKLLRVSVEYNNFFWAEVQSDANFIKRLSNEQIEDIAEEIQMMNEEPLFHPIVMIQEFEHELWQAFIKSPREPVRMFYNWNWLKVEEYGGLF